MAENKEIANLNFNIKDALNDLDKVDKKLKELADSSEAYSKKIGANLSGNFGKQMSANFAESKKEIEKLNNYKVKNEIKAQSEMSVVAFKEQEKRNTYAYKQAIKQEQYNDRVLNSTKTLYDKIAEYGKTYLIYQGFNELRKEIKDTIDEMVNMEYQMVQIDRVFNEGSLNIDNYRDKLIQLAYDYGNSFENVADVTLRLAQAGFDSEEALKLTEKTLLALNTAELDATDATSGMVAIMAQWGLMTGDATQEAKDYGDIIDKINKVADNFPTTSKDILDALKKTSSAFNIAGASIDETIATIVAAEKASQRGGKVIGTALSNIAQQIRAPQRLKLAEEMGLDFFEDEAKTKFKPMMEIFGQMSERMERLKKEGKESSVEMQGLLEMFTIFRRNIGASLLGEMSGEDSTYAEVLKTSIDSVGYSLQENAKHMETAKAAQAQFNAELLKLKTQVWDQGLEGVFRDMLKAGIDLTHGISQILDKFGVLPVSIGAVVLAFTLLGKSTRANNWVGLRNNIKTVNSELGIQDAQLQKTSINFQKYIKSLNGAKASTFGYAKYQAHAAVQTALLTAKTLILQAAISGGITIAITALVSAIDNWVHADEKAIEKNRELKETSEENSTKFGEERKSIEDLRKEYENLAKKDKRSTEEDQKIFEIQEKLNSLIKDSGEQVELVTKKINDQGKEVQVVNDKYDEQIAKIKSVEYEKKKQETEELRIAAEKARDLMVGIKGDKLFEGGIFDKAIINTPMEKLKSDLEEIGILSTQLNEELATGKKIFGKEIIKNVEDLDLEGQYKYFKNARTELEKAKREGKDVSESLNLVDTALKNIRKQFGDNNIAADKYRESLSELYAMSGYADNLTSSLQAVFESYNIEGPRKLIEQIQEINTNFSEGKINVEEYFNAIQEKISQIDLSKEGEELEAYRAIFAETTRSLAEGMESLMSGLESNTINFADYASGMKEAADNTLALRVEQEQLTLNDESMWIDAAGNVDEYANSLQNATDNLATMGDLLTTIGDNYDYIAEHSNAAGEAAFNAADVQTQAYQNLAINVANSLESMRLSNADAYKAITDTVYTAMGDSAREGANANAYITNALSTNAQALNAALNASAKQAAISANNVTQSMGKVLSELGNAISSFDYHIKATPYISGGFRLKKDENGFPTKIELPHFGFDIQGTGGDSIKNLGSALSTFGSDISNWGNDNFKYYQIKSQVPAYQPSSRGGTSSSGSPRGSGGGSRGGGSRGGGSRSNRDYAAEQAKRDAREAERAAREAEKAAEDEYKRKLKLFKDYLAEKERLEKRWVDKQKELGLLSNQDFLFITKERIERHKKYLDEIKKQTWLKAEDRLKLEKEYSEKIEDLQLDYMGYLKDKLEDDIEALEKSNDKKIELIEKEADKRIEALKKVEKENDRIRAKEDYEKKRQEHLNDVNYWSERTGREATEALAEAKKNLKDLDEEWKKQQEDWSNEDQIKKIEEEREAQIKAIQDAQQSQIDAWRAAYEEKVRLFGETGQIIYDNTVIQSEALHNIYKSKFIDPISQELANLNSSINTPAPAPKPSPAPAPAPAPEKRYETYTIRWGDTLSGIAKRFGTSIEKIMAANPYIKNKNRIYAGKTLQIPKFHNGGIVGGTEEGFALLKPNEVVLKPEWADGINKLAKMAKNKENPITNSTVIEVKGDLVKIDANLKNKGDVDYLGRRIEKVLKDKFNIKK